MHVNGVGISGKLEPIFPRREGHPDTGGVLEKINEPRETQAKGKKQQVGSRDSISGCGGVGHVAAGGGWGRDPHDRSLCAHAEGVTWRLLDVRFVE